MIKTLLLILILVGKSYATADQNNCTVDLTNRVAGCVSAKSEFLASRDMKYAATATAGAAGGALGVSTLRKKYAEFLEANRDELIKRGAQQGQIDWAEDWKKDAQGARAADAKKEMETVKQMIAEGKKIVGWPVSTSSDTVVLQLTDMAS